MLRGGEGGRRGPRIDRMGGLVLAMIVGVLVPPLVVSVLGSRDPLPRNCGSGQVSATRLDGAILYTTGADLWYSEGYPGQPRKLVDFAPKPARLSPGATPSPSAGGAAGSAPATPSAAPGSPPASPATLVPVPQVVAADITDDRRLVAVLVVDPPDRPGTVSLRMLSPLDPPGKAPVEGWYNQPDRQPQVRPQVRILSNNKILVIAGVPRGVLSAPSPAVAPSPLPAPSLSPSAGPAPTPSLSSPTAGSPPVSPAAIAVVVDPALAPGGDVVDVAPLDYFLAIAHSGWADTRSYKVSPEAPVLGQRVVGPVASVAGIAVREVGTPLARRRLNQLVVGRSGRRETTVVCAAALDSGPLAFSPDEAGLALFNGRETLYLDLAGTHAATRLLDGKILAWRA